MNDTPVIQTELMTPNKDTLSCILNLAYTLNLNENFDTSVRLSLRQGYFTSELTAFMEKQHPKIKFQYDVLYKKSQIYEEQLAVAIAKAKDPTERFLLTNLLQLKKNIISDGHDTDNVHVWFHSGIATLFYKEGLHSVSWRLMFAFQYDREHYIPVFTDAPHDYQVEMLHIFYNVKGWDERAIAKQFGCSVEYLVDLVNTLYKPTIKRLPHA